MNILEFVKQGGKTKTAAGDFVTITDINENVKYCLSGQVHSKIYEYELIWDEDGNPSNLPCNHGLNLIAVVPVITYNVVSTDQLKEATNVTDLL